MKERDAIASTCPATARLLADLDDDDIKVEDKRPKYPKEKVHEWYKGSGKRRKAFIKRVLGNQNG